MMMRKLILTFKSNHRFVRHHTNTYKSGLEQKNSDLLTNKGHSVSYEKLKIPYQKKPSTYTPDFDLENGIIVETKGYFVAADRTKHRLIKEHHPDLDIRFVFSNPHVKISKRSKTTYADWCNKHGFIYASKLIPEEWINEPVEQARLDAANRFRK